MSSLLGLGPPPWIAGHRGAAGERLENTLESFALAVAQGADLIELDVQLTADGELAVFHDFDLDRLAGRTGSVERLPWAQLATVELGAGLRLPRLTEVLAALPAGFPLNVEVKRRQADPARLADALVAAATDAAPPGHRLVVSSFDRACLDALRERAPRLPLAVLAAADLAGALADATRLGAAALHLHLRLATAGAVALAAAAGLPVLVYTVNDPETARRLFARGVAGVFTDRPGALRAALAHNGTAA